MESDAPDSPLGRRSGASRRMRTRRATLQTVSDAIEHGDLAALRSMPVIDVGARLDTD